MFDLYLDRGTNADSIRQAQQVIATLLPQLGLGTIHVEVDPANAEVTVDGEAVAPARYERVRVAPGEHTVVASASGRAEVSRQASVEAGAVATVTLSLQPADPGANTETGTAAGDEPRERRSVARQWWFWTIIGAVVVGTGLGVGLGVGLAEEPPEGTWRFDLP